MAQRNFTKKLVASRIALEEKMNRPFQRIPDMLINAYRLGLLQGYYPNTIDGKMDFREFARKFRLQSSVLDRKEDFACCSPVAGMTYETKLETEHYPEFGMILDLIEVHTFDQTASMNKYDTRYVRLSYINPANEVELNGVLFHYKDVERVLRGVKLDNYKNDATRLDFPQHVNLRMFHSYIIDLSSNPPVTLAQAQDRKRTLTRKESEYYSR